MEDRENFPSEEREAVSDGDDVEGHSFADGDEREAVADGDDVEGHSFKAEDTKADDGI